MVNRLVRSSCDDAHINICLGVRTQEFEADRQGLDVTQQKTSPKSRTTGSKTYASSKKAGCGRPNLSPASHHLLETVVVVGGQLRIVVGDEGVYLAIRSSGVHIPEAAAPEA